jgi:hypothetical protein
MVIHEPQRMDPYAPTVQSSLPPVPMQQIHQAHNSAAIGSVVVGAVAFCLSLVGFIPGAPVFYYSLGGIFAIIGGIRALVRRSAGFGSIVWAPILAIVLGSLAVVFMVSGIILHSVEGTNSDATGSLSTVQHGTGASAGQATVPLAPTFSSDRDMTNYESDVRVLALEIYEKYGSGVPAPPTQSWPTSMSVTPGGVVMYPDGSEAAQLAVGSLVKYVVSSDGNYFDISVSGGDGTQIAIYDSEANVFTWACEPGAPATCPAGGLQPDSGGSSTTSNT